MARASPTSAAMCRSWPHACMTGTSFPFGSVPVARLAYARQVASSTGSASMSARTSSVGPAPSSSTAAMPCPPIPR